MAGFWSGRLVHRLRGHSSRLREPMSLPLESSWSLRLLWVLRFALILHPWPASGCTMTSGFHVASLRHLAGPAAVAAMFARSVEMLVFAVPVWDTLCWCMLYALLRLCRSAIVWPRMPAPIAVDAAKQKPLLWTDGSWFAETALAQAPLAHCRRASAWWLRCTRCTGVHVRLHVHRNTVLNLVSARGGFLTFHSVSVPLLCSQDVNAGTPLLHAGCVRCGCRIACGGGDFLLSLANTSTDSAHHPGLFRASRGGCNFWPSCKPSPVVT